MPSHRPLRHYRRYPRRSRTPRALRWFAAVVLLLLEIVIQAFRKRRKPTGSA